MGIFNFGKKFESKSVKSIKTKKKIDFDGMRSGIKRFVVVFIIFMILYFRSSIAGSLTIGVKNLTRTVVKNVSSAVGTEPEKDSIGNVNVLLLGIGGKNHDGGYLTDSIMIASFNKKNKAVTFLSIPRDLYVKYDGKNGSKINYVFAREYLRTKDFDKATGAIKDKIKQITGVDINYYVVVDFSGFEKIIDSLGGVTVDVKKDIYDPAYPGPNYTYSPFRISKGIQTLDGSTALKYARSRHGNSGGDFGRSERQEQVMKAIVQKIASSEVLLNPRKAKALYVEFTETVKTDFDFKTLLSFVPHIEGLKMHSYVLNSDCYSRNSNWQNLQSGCFVYPGVRADFGGQAVLLPAGASSRNIEEYSKIKKFAFLVLSYPELWIEGSKIQILNGISNKDIRRKFRRLKPIASDLAFDLKNYGFNISDVGNASKDFDGNIGYVYNKKSITEDLLSMIVGNIDYQTGDVQYKGKGFDISLIIGKEYLDGK